MSASIPGAQHVLYHWVIGRLSLQIRTQLKYTLSSIIGYYPQFLKDKQEQCPQTRVWRSIEPHGSSTQKRQPIADTGDYTCYYVLFIWSVVLLLSCNLFKLCMYMDMYLRHFYCTKYSYGIFNFKFSTFSQQISYWLLIFPAFSLSTPCPGFALFYLLPSHLSST